MRDSKPASPSVLTDEEVEQLIQAHNTPQSLAGRTRLIVRVHQHPQQSNQQIALAVGTTDRPVRT
jgi:hypothetical protein